MLRIWGRISSINVRKVVLCAQELDIDFTRVDAGAAFGLTRTPEYLRKNPNALVPVLEDGDFVLWESNVIVRYLCAKDSPAELYPEDLRERFDAERWMDWQQTTLNPAGRDAFIELIRRPGGQSDAAKVQASVDAMQPLLDMMDAQLAQRAFIAGDSITMADLPLACEMHRWSGLPLAHRPRPHLDRWYQHMCSRASARGVLDLPLS
jgi:glutathione S-transferase